MEAEALAERLRQQLATLRDAQSRQQRSSQERLQALQAHLQSLASRVVRHYLYLDGCSQPTMTGNTIWCGLLQECDAQSPSLVLTTFMSH